MGLESRTERKERKLLGLIDSRDKEKEAQLTKLRLERNDRNQKQARKYSRNIDIAMFFIMCGNLIIQVLLVIIVEQTES